MKISKRLCRISECITEGYRLADIGTDHGYIPVKLVKEGKIPSALAMDIKRGPLKKAEENIRRYGLEDRIQTRLSDGLENLCPGEADSILIAGLGGDLMIKILKEGEKIRQSVKEYVLSPHTRWYEVRKFLRENDFDTTEEIMVKEEGKFYLIIKALPFKTENAIKGRDENILLSDTFGYYLLKNKDKVLEEYLDKESLQFHKILEGLQAYDAKRDVFTDTVKRAERIKEYLLLIKEAKNEIN